MKRNKLLRASAALLILTLITSCFVGGTFAKYVSEADAKDTARVAKWGVTISNSKTPGEDGVYSGGAFSYVYHGPDGTPVGTVSSTEKVVAPGTSGTFETLKISGTPEVAVEIETNVDVELTGSWEDAEENFYFPLKFTINNVKQTINADSAEDFAEKLKELLEGYTSTTRPIPVGTDLSSSDDVPVLLRKNVDLEWEWPFEGANSGNATSGQNDIDDTRLGDIAAGLYQEEGKEAPAISITFTTTVTQID